MQVGRRRDIAGPRFVNSIKVKWGFLCGWHASLGKPRQLHCNKSDAGSIMAVLNVLLLGDLCLATDVESRVLGDSHYDLWAGVRNIVGEDELVVANIECSITERDEPMKSKYAVLRAAPCCVRVLDRLDVAVLSNNHVDDHGDPGAQDTKRHLATWGVKTVGYGQCLSEALRPLVLEKNGIRIGLVGFSCPTTNGGYYATATSPGAAPLSIALLEESISGLRDRVDLLVVYLHWGLECQHYPVVDQMQMGRRTIDFGADAVVGCHAHVIQPYERYKTGWIFYGLGNFLFGSVPWSRVKPDGTAKSGVLVQKPENRQSLGVRLQVTKTAGGRSLELLDAVPLAFDEELVPRRIDQKSLTVDIELLNKKLAEFARRNPAEMNRRAEMSYCATWSGARLVYFYQNRPIDCELQDTWMKRSRRLASRIWRLVRPDSAY